jgi:flagellin-like hook-associated protein FlgL
MNVSSSMSGYINAANAELEIVTHEMSSGEKKTLTSAEYQKKLVLDDDIGIYKKINRDLTLSKVENQVADKVMSEMKDVVTSFKSKMILANNATTSDTDRGIIANELRNYKDAIIDMSNTEVMDNNLFSGSDKSIKPFEYKKDIDGHYTNVTYKGSPTKFEQEIGKNISKGQGLTGLNLMDGLVDKEGSIVIDEKGQISKDITLYKELSDGTFESKDYTAGDIMDTGFIYTSEDNTSGLEPKIIYELDRAIESVENNYTNDDLTVTPPKYTIGNALDRVSDEVFGKLNIQHSQLGNSNLIFERSFEQNEYKLNSLDQILQETVGIDIAEASIKLQQLQLMFASIFSTMQQVNEIEQQLAQAT